MDIAPKRLFKNNTEGWLGVVLIGPTNAPEGKAVEPGGTVYMSDQECRLTAHAPRLAEDNPFAEQEFEQRDQTTGERRMVKLTPLTVVEDTRDIPTGERPIPTERGVSTAEPAPDETSGAHSPELPPQPPPPPSTGPQPLAAPPPVPPAVQQAVDAANKAREEEQATVEEETAVAGSAKPEEETGAAVKPSGDPPAGEFAAHEEVGTPDAPKPYVEGK